jgi:hypothetical protein
VSFDERSILEKSSNENSPTSGRILVEIVDQDPSPPLKAEPVKTPPTKVDFF